MRGEGPRAIGEGMTHGVRRVLAASIPERPRRRTLRAWAAHWGRAVGRSRGAAEGVSGASEAESGRRTVDAAQREGLARRRVASVRVRTSEREPARRHAPDHQVLAGASPRVILWPQPDRAGGRCGPRTSHDPVPHSQRVAAAEVVRSRGRQRHGAARSPPRADHPRRRGAGLLCVHGDVRGGSCFRAWVVANSRFHGGVPRRAGVRPGGGRASVARGQEVAAPGGAGRRDAKRRVVRSERDRVVTASALTARRHRDPLGLRVPRALRRHVAEGDRVAMPAWVERERAPALVAPPLPAEPRGERLVGRLGRRVEDPPRPPGDAGQ